MKDNTDKFNKKNLEEEVERLKSEIKDLSDDIEKKGKNNFKECR